MLMASAKGQKQRV